MRGNLRGVLTRVQRMSVDVKRGDCGKDHHRLRVTMVWGDGPVPAWPEPDTPRTCACGQPFAFRHVIDQLEAEAGPGQTPMAPPEFVPGSTICVGGDSMFPGGYPGERRVIHAW